MPQYKSVWSIEIKAASQLFFCISLSMGKFIEVFAIIMSRYTSKDHILANGAYVGLAPPGDNGSWQRECKVICLTFLF